MESVRYGHGKTMVMVAKKFVDPTRLSPYPTERCKTYQQKSTATILPAQAHYLEEENTVFSPTRGSQMG